MKFRFAAILLLSLFAIPLLSLSAQDQAASLLSGSAPDAQGGAPAPTDQAVPATPTTPSTPDPAAPAANSGQGSPGENPPPSDPNSLIPPPAELAQPSPINAAGNEEKQRQDQKARYYSAKVKVDKEEALASLLQKSDKAKSDEAKRQTLREYYDLLAKRMKKIDPSLSEWVDTMHAAYLRRLAQVTLEPTIPVNVPPTPDSNASPSPARVTKSQSAAGDETPAPKKKKKTSSSNN
jgi:hypothetical protein